MVPRDQGGQVRGGHPVQPANAGVGCGSGSRGGGILAATDHGDLDGRPGQQAQRRADDRGPLQRGVQAVERHAQRARIGPGRHVPRARRARGEPGGRGAHRDHHGAPRYRAGSAARCSSVSTTTTSAARSAGRVDEPEHDLPEPAIEAAIPAGVAGADEVVQDHRDPAEQQPGQVHVEVAEVTDDHGVGPRPAPGRAGKRRPAGRQPEQQQRSPPGPGQHRPPWPRCPGRAARCTR